MFKNSKALEHAQDQLLKKLSAILRKTQICEQNNWQNSFSQYQKIQKGPMLIYGSERYSVS